MKVIKNEIADLVQRKHVPADRVNVFWSLFALMSTREILPIRCGEQQGDWLCRRCCFSIISEWEWIKKDERIQERLGLTFHYFDRDKDYHQNGYHWRRK